MFAKNRAAANAPAPAGSRPSIALSAAQSTAARRMQQSKQTVPHFYLQTSANAEPILRARSAAGGNLAWDAFLVHAAGVALKKFDRLVYRYEADRLVPPAADAVGVAVDHEDELYVVAIADPATKTPARISDELRALVGRLRAGDQAVRRLHPANLTITNLGSTGVESFTAIINPPEAAILAVGRAAPTAVVQDGKVIAQTRLTLTLSADHRVVSGKYAAGFLDEVVRILESF